MGTRTKKISVSEKIDLIESYLKENPNEEIHTNTMYKGYKIGVYFIQLRQSMIYDSHKSYKYTREDMERMMNLGLLYPRRDTIQEKVDRIKEFCHIYPYAFSDIYSLKKRLEKEGKVEQLDTFIKLFSDYKYLITRKAYKKIPKEMLEELTNARVGGGFGLDQNDKKIKEEYDIKENIIVRIVQEFGSIVNFRKQFIQYQIDMAKAKNDKEKKLVIEKNQNILKYNGKIPLVENFDLCQKEGYNLLLEKIGIKNLLPIGGNVIDSKMDEVIDSILDKYGIRNKRIMELYFGLDGKGRLTYEAIANKFNITRSRVCQTVNEILEKLKSNTNEKTIKKHIYKPTVKFIKFYFNKRDIFISKDKMQMTQEEKDELMSILKKEKKLEKRGRNKNLSLAELELNTRQYNCLTTAGIKSITDLLKMSLLDLRKIHGLGTNASYDIICKLHKLGFRCKFEDSKENLNQLGFGTKLYTKLKKIGIKSIDDLLKMSLSDIEENKDLSKRNKDEIINTIHLLGYRFKSEEKSDTKNSIVRKIDSILRNMDNANPQDWKEATSNIVNESTKLLKKQIRELEILARLETPERTEELLESSNKNKEKISSKKGGK